MFDKLFWCYYNQIRKHLQVDTYVTTELLRFITEPGALTRESYDKFQQTVREMGGETMEQLYQAAYERYQNKIA